ncbi:hypothetical protein [Bacillus sp. JJ722]|uniref:hypothetical protein n=1 Tax=Bacillus sp. JJ722 TaxID=3122973 RepID=UPI002FFE528D
MRKFMFIAISIIIVISLLGYFYFTGFLDFRTSAFEKSVEKNNIHYAVRVNENQIEKYDGEKWNPFVIKGISVSDRLPGNEKLTKEQMMDWLEKISKMNVNTIRIPSIQSPVFYNAIDEFNKDRENPLYIIHEIPLQEKFIHGEYGGVHEDISEQLNKDIEDTIDVLHGRKIMLKNGALSSGIYLNGISQYVLGYVIGNQWDPAFVKINNKKNDKLTSFDGQYIEANTVNATEYLIAQAMDYAISYESKKYNQQRLVSFLNTTELDPIMHMNQSKVFRDTNLNIENVQEKEDLHSGIFASYQVSPNDPDFLNMRSDSNADLKDDNYFEEYLKKLKDVHQKPVVITNIGLSTSRGISKEDDHQGYDRGGMSEKEQGEKLTELLDDIYENYYAGAIVYNWQDEWDKSSTWNTRHIKNTTEASNWLDVQSSEQNFGIMQFVPNSEVLMDGKTDDWKKEDLLFEDKNNKLYAKYDSSYLYVMIKDKGFHLYNDRLFLAMDVNPSIGSKNYKEENIDFDLGADFVVRLHGKQDSDIQVQSRYNIFDFRYKYYSNILDQVTTVPTKDSNQFDPIYLLTRNAMQNDETMQLLSPKYYETGSFVFGNTDYKSKDYHSLADFNVKDGVIELRIPWLLINVMDPMNGIVLGDFYQDGIASKEKIKNIGLQVIVKDEGEMIKATPPSYLQLKKIKNIQYQERTKESYEVLQTYFKNLNK